MGIFPKSVDNYYPVKVSLNISNECIRSKNSSTDVLHKKKHRPACQSPFPRNTSYIHLPLCTPTHASSNATERMLRHCASALLVIYSNYCIIKLQLCQYNNEDRLYIATTMAQ